VTGKDYQWFFDAYFYQAKLPELRTTRDGDDLVLSWKTPSGKAFPMPVEVKVGDKIVTAPMSRQHRPHQGGRHRAGDRRSGLQDPAPPALSGRLRGLEEGRGRRRQEGRDAKKAAAAKPAKKK
jgi:hypothetical protein